MVKRTTVIAGLLTALLLGFLLWSLRGPGPVVERPLQDESGPGTTVLPESPSPPETADRWAHIDGFHTDAQSPFEDLITVDRLLFHYRMAIKDRDSNPIGTNTEITRALTGTNSRGLQFFPPGHPAIDPSGQLCDRWGQPYFFHALSRSVMEIRSAGPDGIIWSDDDLVLTPE